MPRAQLARSEGHDDIATRLDNTHVVITRRTGYLAISTDPVPEASEQLQRDGFVMLRSVFDAGEVAELVADIERVFAEWPPDERSERSSSSHWEPFRYEMLNRSAVVQRAIAQPAILDVIEPLLGEDCHVIANTAWRQPADDNEHGGRFWHIDSGPHVPAMPRMCRGTTASRIRCSRSRPTSISEDCPIEAGPTGRHRAAATRRASAHRSIGWTTTTSSGTASDRAADRTAGDVALFVSDVWHRRLPSLPGDPGRFFLQCHYGAARPGAAAAADERLEPVVGGSARSGQDPARAHADRPAPSVLLRRLIATGPRVHD